MLITAQLIKKIEPHARGDLASAIADNWHEAEAAGINTLIRAAHFIARILVETGGLTSISEKLNYSADRLTEVWPTRFPTIASARPYAKNPEKLAEKVYAGRMGNTQPGDGFRFRGAGMLQTTGRAGFAKFGLENDPDKLREPTTAFLSAVQEWAARGCNKLADRDDVVAVCKAINGGTTGLSEQRAYLAKVKAALAAQHPLALPATVPVSGIADIPPLPNPKPSAAASAPSQDGVAYYVQERLRALGYFEVGAADGEIGSRSQGAITAFRIDNGLPIADADQMPLGIDNDLLATLGRASPRAVSQTRATATVKQLRQGDPVAGIPASPVLKQTFRMRAAAWIGGAFSALIAAVQGIGDKIPDVKAQTSWVLDLFGSIPPWAYGLGVVALCVIVYGGARTVEAARVQQHRDGEVT